MRKTVLALVAVLAVAVGGFFGWRQWTAIQRESRYDAWEKELLAPPPPDDPNGGPDETRRNEVVAELKKDLKEDPGLTHASLLLAKLQYRADKKSDAKLVLENAVKQHPEAVEAGRNLASICRELGLIDESIRALSETLVHAEGPLHSRVQLELGDAYLEKYRGSSKEEDFRAARNAFQDARSDSTTEAEAMDDYGRLWLEKGRFRDLEKALATFKELLQKHPDYPNAAKIQEVVDVLSKQGG